MERGRGWWLGRHLLYIGKRLSEMVGMRNHFGNTYINNDEFWYWTCIRVFLEYYTSVSIYRKTHIVNIYHNQSKMRVNLHYFKNTATKHMSVFSLDSNIYCKKP